MRTRLYMRTHTFAHRVCSRLTRTLLPFISPTLCSHHTHKHTNRHIHAEPRTPSDRKAFGISVCMSLQGSHTPSSASSAFTRCLLSASGQCYLQKHRQKSPQPADTPPNSREQSLPTSVKGGRGIFFSEKRNTNRFGYGSSANALPDVARRTINFPLIVLLGLCPKMLWTHIHSKS
jgi:hypothetical protein